MPTAKTKIQEHKPLIIGLSTTWVLTILGFVWTASSLNTSYNNRITNLEEDLKDAVQRIQETETAQTRILTDLAEIKTDIAWIRRQLERSE